MLLKMNSDNQDKHSIAGTKTTVSTNSLKVNTNKTMAYYIDAKQSRYNKCFSSAGITCSRYPLFSMADHFSSDSIY